jgi:O-acetyl-ADP-ribose deacetylase (regulator of RNase III)
VIELRYDDLLKCDAEALVNTVNCVGVMGKGIALAFKTAYPANFKAYEAACKRKEVRPGTMFVSDIGDMFAKKWIVNFPTKLHWRNPSEMVWIDNGLKDLVRFIIENKVASIAIPALGCSKGGLPWNDVRPRIEQAMEPLINTRVYLYPPQGN